MKRTCLAFVLLLALAPACLAGSFTLTFDGLTDGQSLTSYTTQGFTLDDPNGFIAVAAGSPYYLGVEGLHPLGNDFSITRNDGSSFVVKLLGYSFGYMGSSGQIDSDTLGIAGGVPKYIIAIDTTNGLNPDALQNPLPPVDTLSFQFNNSQPRFQLTEIRLGLHSVVPEPSSFVIAALGATICIGYAWARNRRARR